MRQLAVELQGIRGLVLAHWWMESGPGVADRGASGPRLELACWWVELVPDVASCRIHGVPKLVSACW